MPTLYDVLPADVREKFPLETLTPKWQQRLSARLPEGYPPEKAAAKLAALGPIVPKMTAVHAAVQEVRKGSRGELGSVEPDPLAGSGAGFRMVNGRPTAVSNATLYAEQPVAARVARRVVDAGMRALPAAQEVPQSLPPAQGFAEHAADVAGGLAGFGVTTAILAPVMGPLALGGAAAAPAGSLKDRAIRGVTTQAAGAVAGKVAGAIAPEGAGTARQALSHAPGAVAFGAVQPWAAAWLQKATGDKNVAPPTLKDMTQGGGELFLASLILHGAGATAAKFGRQPTPGEAAIAETVKPPAGAPHNADLSDKATRLLAGKPIGITLPDGTVVAGQVHRVFVYETGGQSDVRVLASDPQGHLAPIAYPTLADFSRGIVPQGERPLARLSAREAALRPEPESKPNVVPKEVTASLPIMGPLDKFTTGLNERAEATLAQGHAEALDRLTALKASPEPRALSARLARREAIARAETDVAEHSKRGTKIGLKGDQTKADAAPVEPAAPAPTSEPARLAPQAPEEKSRARAEAAPLDAEKAARYREHYAKGYAEAWGNLDEPNRAALEKKLRAQANDSGADPHDREGAGAALALIEAKKVGAGPEEPGTGRKAPVSADPSSPVDASAPPPGHRFGLNEWVRVPNETNRRNDKRATVRAVVTGHEMKNGDPHVHVMARRGGQSRGSKAGKFSWTPHTFPESKVVRLPTVESKARAADVRATRESKLRASIEKRAAGDPEKAEEIARHYDDLADKAQAAWPEGASTSDPAYIKARKDWNNARQAAAMAERHRDELIRAQNGEQVGTFDSRTPRGKKRPLDQVSMGEEFAPQAGARSIGGKDDTESARAVAAMGGEHADYESFEKAYRAAFAKANRYKPGQIGFDEGSAEMARLADAYPEWAERAESAPQTSMFESRMPGAAATAKPRAQRGIPIAKPFTAPLADPANLPATPLPKPAAQAAARSPVQSIVEAIKRVGYEITAAVNPVHLAPSAGVDAFMEAKGGLKQALLRADTNQGHLRAWADKLKPENVLDFLDRYEHGKPLDPRLQAQGDAWRDRLDNAYKAIKKYRDLPYWENYFPHLWKNPELARQFMASRRPMEGSKRFLKSRSLDDLRAGLDAGLEPTTWNLERMVQAVEHDARKFVMVQELLIAKDAVLRQANLVKRGALGARAGRGDIPEDFVPFDQPWAKVFISPVQEIKEWHDKAIMEGLKAAAARIGAKLDRKLAIGGQRLGYSQSSPGVAGKVVTRFGSPLSVLAHEIGHALDAKYGLRDVFLHAPNKRGQWLRAELRALADLRFEGSNPEESFKKYVRSGPEKMAVMLEAFIHAPERFRQVAPNTYEAFREFLGSHPETKGILDIKPSLTFTEGTAEVHAGGAVLGGQYWGQKDLVRIIDNYMSRDLIGETTAGRSIMASRNLLNAIDLGLSGFHFTGISLLSVMSRASAGVFEMYHGAFTRQDPQMFLRGAMKFTTSPAAPVLYTHQGWKFFLNDPTLSQFERDVFTGGASLEENQYYNVGAFDNFVRNVRARNVGKAILHAPGALLTGPMQAMSRWYIPQAKVGAFIDAMASEVAVRADDIAAGRVTREYLARKTWNNIENRMGLLNYDNLHWNRTLKAATMILVRAPGWTLGTLREFGGTMFIDLPRNATEAAHGKVPELTQRTAFAFTMAFTTIAVGGIYHYLHTGQRPKTLEDFLHPKNGAKDGNGRDVRIDFPTYWKDVEHWGNDPVGAAVGRIKNRDGSSSLFHGGKLAPEVTMFMDLVENQTYRGPIFKPIDGPLADQSAAHAEEALKYLLGRATPFSVQSADALKQASAEERTEAFFGVTRHSQPVAKKKSARHWLGGK